MKHLLYTLLLLSFLLSNYAIAQTTNNEKIYTYDFGLSGVKEIASPQKKPIFAFIYTPTNSKDYKTMMNITFLDSKVIEFYNYTFVNTIVSTGTKEGMEFVSAYNLTKYPVSLYIDSNGKLLALDYGTKTPEEILSLGDEALSKYHAATDETLPIVNTAYNVCNDRKLQYENGCRSASFLRDYARTLRDFNESYGYVLDDYLNSADFKSNASSGDNMQFIFDFADELNSKAFEILQKNKSLYVGVFGKGEVDTKILQAIRSEVITASISKNPNALDRALRYVNTTDIPNNREEVAKFKLLYHKEQKNWVSYGQVADTYYRTEIDPSAEILNMAAREIVSNSNNKEQLEKSLLWVNKALNLRTSDFEYNETNAIILYKLGKKKQAVKELDIAIDKARKTSNDYTYCLELMQIMNADKQISLPAK